MTVARGFPCLRLPGVTLLLLALAWGCGGPPPAANAPSETDADTQARQEINTELSQVINDATTRYLPLRPNYNEDLIQQLDQIEARNAGQDRDRPIPRFLPNLDEPTELEHFRETIRRYEDQAGASLRSVLDPLLAEIAARKPDGPRFHPDFHQRVRPFLEAFVRIEVLGMQERRNQAVHDHAAAVLDRYRSRHPELVREFEETLDQQYPRIVAGGGGVAKNDTRP